jgi:PPOX class probable F420-dependent enzyme
MDSPQISRPFMPGYGIAGPDAGSGLLPWSWAAERLAQARNYWVATVWPDGRPHASPVWGMWDDSVLWFTCAAGSRKARNLRAQPACVVTTEDASDPVIVEGTAQITTDQARIRHALDLMNAKYHADIEIDFLDPARNCTIALRPDKVIGMRHDDFTGSPTRWVFGAGPGSATTRGG